MRELIMNTQQQLSLKFLLFIPVVLLLTSCTAGDARFAAEAPAGFWYGLWHGVISFISLIIHLFNDTVMVYEANNTGGWYDFGGGSMADMGIYSLWPVFTALDLDVPTSAEAWATSWSPCWSWRWRRPCPTRSPTNLPLASRRSSITPTWTWT